MVRRYAEDPVVGVVVPPPSFTPRRHRRHGHRHRHRRHPPPTPPHPAPIRRMWDAVSRGGVLRRLLLRLRRALEGRTVYVLECAGGRYYVGSTTDRRRRYREHASRRRGGGSRWTRMHPPVAVLAEYRRVPRAYLLGMESRVTAEMMLAHGVNNVRGSMFCGTRDYHLGDVDALAKFLGHYNDLDYGEVRAGLRRTLPPPPAAGGGGGPAAAAKAGGGARRRCP